MSRVQGVESHVIDGVLHVHVPDTAVGDEDAPIKAFAFHFPAGVKRSHLAKTMLEEVRCPNAFFLQLYFTLFVLCLVWCTGTCQRKWKPQQKAEGCDRTTLNSPSQGRVLWQLLLAW